MNRGFFVFGIILMLLGGYTMFAFRKYQQLIIIATVTLLIGLCMTIYFRKINAFDNDQED